LFYQALIDTRSDPRIYATQISTVFQTDLATLGGQQPRISPKNDTILFNAINDQTTKHDLYRMSDRGGMAQNITNTPEADEVDASWSRDGGKIVFASDRAVDAAGQRNYDIWMIDLAKPDQPIQITSNASHDDSPAFDVSGSAVFFRSNRGGEWGIWKVAVK
jgi:Tol biopolymer transport system component